MSNWLTKYFGFSKRERRGIYVLLLLLALFLVFPTFYSWFKPENKNAISGLDENEIHTFLASMEKSTPSNEKTEIENAIPVALESVTYFTFNPNTLSIDDGIALGLTERQVKMIQNYVAKGGAFYKKEDFSRIYAVSEQDYARLAPYISIPVEKTSAQNRQSFNTNTHDRKGSASFKHTTNSNKENPASTAYTSSKSAHVIIELNIADSTQLQQLRGIGPVFASRIIKFREGLGGFYDVSQLLQVYGMDEDRLEGIKNQLVINHELIKKVNINRIDYEELRKHSIISNKQANAIIQYRKQHGDFVSIHDLSKIATLNEDFLLKIAPYLKFSE